MEETASAKVLGQRQLGVFLEMKTVSGILGDFTWAPAEHRDADIQSSFSEFLHWGE